MLLLEEFQTFLLLTNWKAILILGSFNHSSIHFFINRCLSNHFLYCHCTYKGEWGSVFNWLWGRQIHKQELWYNVSSGMTRQNRVSGETRFREVFSPAEAPGEAPRRLNWCLKNEEDSERTSSRDGGRIQSETTLLDLAAARPWVTSARYITVSGGVGAGLQQTGD